jgi:hypothetical protein
MAIGALIAGGAALLGGALSSKSAKDAAKTGANAELQAMAMQLAAAKENRDIGLALQAPGRQAGYTALAGLMDMAGLSRAGFAPSPTGGSDGTPSLQPGVRPSGAGGYTPDGKAYIPTKPKEFQGTDSEWSAMYQAYLANPGDFVNKGGKYFDTPAGAIGATGDPVRGLYGRSGKVWGQIMGNLRDSTTGQNAPFNTETLGVPNLAGIPAYDFKADPGYQFRQQEGMRLLENSAAARGGLLSGGFARAVTQYGQDMASQEYGNVFNRLATIAGYGQTAVQGSQNAATNTAGMIGQASGGIANAGAYRASGYIGQGNSWATTMNQLGELAGSWGGAGGVDAGTNNYLLAAGRAGVSNPQWP